MSSQLFFRITFILLFPILSFALDTPQQEVKLIQKPNTHIIENKTINQKKENLNEDKQVSDESKQIILQNKLIEDVIEKINSEYYTLNKFDQSEYKKELNLITNKINVNKRQNNTLAIKRDELKLFKLNDKKMFSQTLEEIVTAKKEYKDKQYFIDLLNKNIDSINSLDISNYTAIYNSEIANKNNISKAFTKNYIQLYNQIHTELYILGYLKENISKFRNTNFFIDEFNLQYFVNKIDSLPGISFISGLTSYHLNFSIGEIIVVLLIILLFRLLNTKVISLTANVISRLFVKETSGDSELIKEYLRKSIDSPLIFALYTLSIQISIYILVQDTALILKIMPWINTIYIALLTWGLYSILNNSINIYAHSLLNKYPNVRKEIIAFVLKIIKFILVLFVILFLFSQLGIDIKAIAASLGVGGIAIALASKDTLANFFGSLNIMTDNSFSQGDWIKTTSIEGTVVDIRMRTTRIRTFDNAMITIPNSQLANDHIMNWSKRKIGRRIKMNISITYKSKMEDIINLKDDLNKMLKEHPSIASDKNSEIAKSRLFESIKKEDLQGVKRTLLVYIDSFGASSIDILVYCFSRSPKWEDWLETKEDVLIKIAQLVEKNNCEFAYPTQTLLLKNDEEISTMTQEK